MTTYESYDGYDGQGAYGSASGATGGAYAGGGLGSTGFDGSLSGEGFAGNAHAGNVVGHDSPTSDNWQDGGWKDGSSASEQGDGGGLADMAGNALDGMRNAFENVVDGVKDVFAGGEETSRNDQITYNQINEATPDPSLATSSGHGINAMGDEGNYSASTGAVSDDCGAISGRACGTRQTIDTAMGDTAAHVERARNEIDTATYSEREI